MKKTATKKDLPAGPQDSVSKPGKTFDTVKVFREIKEKIAKETGKMTFAEFKEYLNKNKLQTAK
jgi:hypothetical protein